MTIQLHRDQLKCRMCGGCWCFFDGHGRAIEFTDSAYDMAAIRARADEVILACPGGALRMDSPP